MILENNHVEKRFKQPTAYKQEVTARGKFWAGGPYHKPEMTPPRFPHTQRGREI